MRKFYVLLITGLFFCCSGFAQILNASYGGFESGTTFLANNWTAVNSVASSNNWAVGPLIKNTGSRSVYVSTDGGTTNTSDNTIASVSHFYTDVTVPAGITTLTLSFYVEGNTNSSQVLHVYADQSSPTPQPDVSLGLGGNLIWNMPFTNGSYVIQSANITGLTPGSLRIIFSWENDGLGPVLTSPASIDNIFLCSTPTAFNVTGGGDYCTGGTGVHIGLSNSEVGVDYQLMNPGPVGGLVPGTGLPLDFGLQTAAGTYTVVATSGTCNNTMAGNAVVTIDPPPAVSAGSDFTISCTTNPTGKAIGEPNDVTATYSWTPAAGLSSTTLSNPNADPGVTTIYTVTKTVTATGCSNMASVTVTVNNSGASVSAGSPFTITCTSNTGGLAIGEPNDATATYSWSPATGLSNATISNPVATPAISTTYTVTKTITASGCSATATVDVTVNNTPPTVSAGSPFTITCTANTTGAAIGELNDPAATYSWSPALGLSSTTVSNPTATPAVTTTYTVIKTNTANGCTNTASVIVTVDKTPPAVSAGSPFTKTCTTFPTGTNIGEPNDPAATYSWSPAAGLSSSTVSNPNADPAVTTTYTVTKTTTANGCTATAPVIVTVDNTIPVVDITGSSSICLPGTTTLSPTTGGTWISDNPGVASVSNAGVVTGVSGGTATFTFTQTSTGCANTTSAVTVTPTPDVNTVTDQNLCKGAATTAITFTGSVPATTYNWTNDNTLIGLAANGSGNISSFTAVNTGTTILTANITVTPTIGGCTGTPKTFSITVDPNPTMTTPPNQTLCNGTLTTAITFVGAVGGTTYSWTNSDPTIGLPASGTGDIASFTAVNAGATNVTATITVTPSASGCGGTPISFTITVKPTPTVGPIADQAVCKGANTTAIAFTGAVAGTTFGWTNSAPSIGLLASGSGNIAAFTGQNAGTAPVTGNIVVTPVANGCTGSTINFNITVNPIPTVVTPADQTVCNGASTAAVTFTGAVTGTIYNWTNSNTTIGLAAASGTGNIASFTTTNPGTLPAIATIQVTPTVSGCTGTPANFNIRVNPTTTVNPVTSQVLCNGTATAAITFTSPVTGTSYTWTNSAPSIGLAASGTTSTIPSFTATNVSGVPVIATITVTPTANLCPGTPLTFTITVNPTATVTNPGNQVVCKGAPVTINFTGTAGATFNWTNDNTAIGLGATGAGNIAFTALNDTSIAKVGNIAVTPTANGCVGTTVNFSITVNPSVALTGNTMAGQGCNKTAFSLAPVDSVDGVVPAGTTFSWGIPVVTGGMTGGAAGTGAAITGNITNPTAVPQTATYTVNSTSGTCTGIPFTLVVTIYPNPARQTIDFFQTNVKSQQLCIGAQVGGGGQNDLDVHFDPPLGGGGQPPNNYYDLNNYDWDWQYATGTPVGPTVPFSTSPGTTTTHYQNVLPPTPSVFSPIGDYWFRFALTQNGCTTYSDTIHLQVTSTLVAKAGGPYVRCSGSGPITLSGSGISGTATTTISGQWSIFSGGGSLSNGGVITTGNAAISAVTYTPAFGPLGGTAKLVLRSNDPDGAGTCDPAADTATIIVLPGGNLQGCTAPASWTLLNTNGDGSIDATQAPCAATLIGSDNNSGSIGTTDYKICSGTGNFSFNWVFSAPTTGGATPVWHSADQTSNAGAGTNRGSFVVNKPANLALGDLIVVILHARDNVGSVASPDGFSSIRKDVSGNSGNDNRGTVLSYWKVATAADLALPAVGSYSFQANSMGTNDTWVAVAGRVTGADTTNPVDVSNGTNSGTGGVTSITAPALTTLGPNRLLIGAVSIIGATHGVIGGTGATSMTTIFSANSTLGDDITYGDYFQNIPTSATLTKQYSWTTNGAAAVQMFAIKPASIPDDSAFAIVNGVQTLISGVSGTSGAFSIPVNTNDQIGFRIKTKTNTGGRGLLTFYNLVVPNDTPKVTGTAAITIPACNPGTPSSFFVAPTLLPDNCGTPTLLSMVDGPVVNSGCTNTQTRTWIYQDNCLLQSKPFVQTLTWTSDLTPPSVTCVPNQTPCFDPSNNYTIPVISATDLCAGGILYSYAITGATTRSGTGSDASGLFNIGTSTITWTVKDGCGNTTTCTTSVIIGTTPTAVISGTANICNGSSTNLSIAFTGTAPWSFSYTTGGAPITITNILTSPYTLAVNPSSTTTYSLTDMTSANCGTGNVSGSATITVKPLPTAVISGGATICSGSSTDISIAPTGTSPWSVTYTDGTTPVTITGITSSPQIVTVSPATTTTYTLTAVSDANCSGTFSGSALITVNQKPNVAVTPLAPSICSGSSIGLTASGALTYSWSPAAGLSATTGATVVANPTTTTTYTVTGTDANGCINTTTVTVSVSIPPVTTGITICQGGSGSLTSATTCTGGTFTAGPANATNGANVGGIGTIAWGSPANITAPIGTPYATASMPASVSITNYLQGTGYGFSIPTTATITAITVVINRSTSAAGAIDGTVQLLKAGALTGDNVLGGPWPTPAFGTHTYVGTTNALWNTTWTPAQINAGNFGVALSARNTVAAVKTLSVDYMQISVTYTVPGTLTWYTVSSGGTSVQSSSTFNPVNDPEVVASPLPYSNLVNTNTPGTYTFYAECPINPGCRTATDFIINAPTVAGTLSIPAATCVSTAGTLTLSGNTGNVVQWESSINNGGSWTIIANTTTTLNYPAPAQSTLYRALVQSGTCASAYSSVATVGVHNLWTGVTSSDWNTASNWSDGQVPTATPCLTVTIPQVVGPAVYPILSSGTATITNLVINANATATISGTGVLQIAGSITNNGTFDASNGTVEFNSTTTPQTIAAGTFTGNAVKNLVITNAIGSGVTLAGPVDVTRSLTYNINSGTLTTGGFLTLKSTATETAWIGDMTNHIITGNVTVERYINTGIAASAHHKAWQLLGIPTDGAQTIKQSWQEGAVTVNGNPKPGFGTMLTSDVGGATGQPSPGFDAATPTGGPSIKVYNSATGLYVGPPNTSGTAIYNKKGYFLFVRGDRSIITAAAPANATTMRTTGTLFTPGHLPNTSTVGGGTGFESVGNPYASAIDLTKLALGSGPNRINSAIITWDPTIGGLNGLGAFQTLFLSGANYINLLTSPAYGPAGTVNNFIQSGQAFIIQSVGTGGTLSFTEATKASGSTVRTFAPTGTPQNIPQLRTSLYGLNTDGSAILVDGALIQYSTDFANAIDGEDARKMINSSENLSVKSGGKLIVLERRQPIVPTDTVFYNLTGVSARPYHFEFVASGLGGNGLEGFVEDTYLETKIPLTLEGTTQVDFTVTNIAGSFAADRFRIVFAPSAVLPVTFTSVKAYKQDKNINVEWRVENEMNMKQYEVEKSTDGIQFTRMIIKPATANGGRSAIYVTTDVTPVTGYNYYRIKSVDMNGKTAYTNIVKVLIGTLKHDITINPNPITDGIIHLQFLNQPEGKYGIRLLNKLGQVIMTRQITRMDGTNTELIKWDYSLAHGVYQLEVTKPDGSIKDLNVLY